MNFSTPVPGAKPGLWTCADCDLRVLAGVPRELAFSVVAGTVSRQRDEMANGLLAAGGSDADVRAMLQAIPDLSSVAARLRRSPAQGRPRGRLLTRLTWALRRARIFLEAFAPPMPPEDPVLEDRAFDLLLKVVFLLDLLDAWRDPAVALATRKTG